MDAGSPGRTAPDDPPHSPTEDEGSAPGGWFGSATDGRPPVISLPKGGGAIRGIGEKFTVNAATGTASASIPLGVSPGRRGFGPALSLNYDSGIGNGPMGLGWRLGLSAITRKTDKGIPTYRDGGEVDPGTDSARDGAADTFVLSGAEDLVPRLAERDGQWLPVHSPRVESGREFTVYEYCPRVEGLFARIERWVDAGTGQSHWRSIDRENVTTTYGRDANSRIADPRNPATVFSWLICETYNDIGDIIRYEYKAEDAAGVGVDAVNERNRDDADRSAQRYLKRIRYGNRISRWLNPEPAADDWLFEVVLDYGEHDPSAPTPAEERPWTCRLDPFSNYRAGFEVRTYRLCRRVLMFHHIDEPNVGADCLVSATELTYRGEPTRGESVVSVIDSVCQRGFRRRAGGDYVTRALPPVQFTYSEACIDTSPRTLDAESSTNLPIGLAGSNYRWVDLDGEGLSGILTEQAHAWYYKPNRGDGRFGPLRTVARPAQAALGSGRQQLLDLDGDGNLELVEFSDATSGFTERSPDGGWTVFQPFRRRPTIDWTDPNLRFIDLNGDGHPDVLIADDQVLNWHAALGTTGYGAAQRVPTARDEERGPRVVFGDGTQSVQLADMSGDGLTDLVRIRNGEICYWPNLGYGRFGAKVAMDNAPWFDRPDAFDPGRIRLADIDGSGTTDVIYLHADSTRLFVNRSGNSWSPAHDLGVAFPRLDSGTTVTTIDLLGNGTACLVWSSPLPSESGRQLRYLDLMGGQKPHLLVEMRNNLGAHTRVNYAPSTRFYVADADAGRPWVTRLPFPVHVVHQVETVDAVGRNRFHTRYAYHHGYFDGVEREFRGFGMVEQFDTEHLAALGNSVPPDNSHNWDERTLVAPAVTKTWFHTGAMLDDRGISRQFADEYHPDDHPLPDSTVTSGLTADEKRQAARALRGKPVRHEVYALDGSAAQDIPYQVTEHNYTVTMRQPARREPDSAGLRNAVFLASPRETLTAHYERQADPRISHEVVLAVDDYGNVLRSAAVGYGRRHPDPDPALTDIDHAQQRRHHLVLTEHDYTNRVELPDAHRVPLSAETRVFEVLALSPTKRLFGFAELRAGLDDIQTTVPYEVFDLDPGELPRPARRLVEQTRTLFRRDDLSGPSPAGVLESMALPFESYRKVFTPGLLDAVYGDRIDATVLAEAGYLGMDDDWWIPSGRIFYSPEKTPGPAELEFAREHFFLPYRFRDPFGAVTSVTYDRYDLLVTGTRDPLGNQITVGERDAADRLISNGNDYRILAPGLITDVNRNRRAAAFDALGRLAGTAVMGKREESLGDSLSAFDPDPPPRDIRDYFDDPLADPAQLLGSATTRILYDELAYWRSRDHARPRPTATATLARETHDDQLADGDIARIQHNLSYSDGFGREVQQKAQAEPGPLADAAMSPRWVGSGWTIFNNKGKPVRSYEPFFTASHRFEFATIVGVSSVLFYDPLERIVATVHPDGTYAKTVFDPWRQDSWDGNDTVLLDPRDDPDIGDLVRPYLDSLPGRRTWYLRRIDGALGPAHQRAARLTAAHAATPLRAWFDTLGRTFLSVAHNRFRRGDHVEDERYATRTMRDIEGNEREIRDAADRVVMRYGYDMLGRRITHAGMDTGGGPALPDALDNTVYHWTAREFRFRTEFDRLRRPVRTWMRGPEQTEESLYLRTEYGEDQPDAATHNLRGQMFRRFDQAGVNIHGDYDFKGNLVEVGRQLTVEDREVVDWSDDVPVEEHVYRGHTRYDALNRPTAVTTPDGSVVYPGYNEANLLERIDVALRGASEWTTFVANLDYNARGQRTLIDYGNGASTGYEYDPATFRLVRLTTLRAATRLQDLDYTYDPVGNVTTLRDDAQQTVFFRNRVVHPRAEYVYDAAYRLIEATGREHVGQGSATPPDAADAPREGVSHPADAAAMGRYLQRYCYDAVGNILRMAHRTDDPARGGWTRDYLYTEPSLLQPDRAGNRLSATATPDQVTTPTPFHYDVHGNITAMPELPTMRWDPDDHLQDTARSTGGETTRYTYDAAGTRVRKVSRHADGRRRSERIYWGAFEIHREYGADGAVTLARETLHIVDDNQRIAVVETRTEGTDNGLAQLVRYQFANLLGSAVLELDGTAQVITYEEYYPYGSTSYQAVRSQTETPKRYRFTGKERDTETGLYYHGARYYAPWLGRWTSPDPAGVVDGPNLYVYVRNNPAKLTDPTGHLSWGQWAGIAAAVVIGTVVTVATAGLAGPVVGTAAAAVIGGIVGGAVGGGVGEALEAHIDKRESHILRSAIIGGVIGGVFAGAGAAIGAVAKTTVAQGVANRFVSSAAAQFVRSAAARIGQSAAGQAARRAGTKLGESSVGKATAGAAARVGSALRSVHEFGERGGSKIAGRLAGTPAEKILPAPVVPGVRPGEGAGIAQNFKRSFGESPEAIDVVGSRAEAQATGNWPDGSGPAASDIDVVITTKLPDLDKASGAGFEFFKQVNPGKVPTGVTGIGYGPDKAYIGPGQGAIPKGGTIDPFFSPTGADTTVGPAYRIWPTPITPPTGGVGAGATFFGGQPDKPAVLPGLTVRF
ncbi:SpvB/TcaC N-terminal domain-containing protein [Nocardia sp. GCM10030253]|uniref:SpvB/TcaC N-terminal domain-containing protein n=1 Tax=Nocardia sp. GCM10030253 TaxID=3273404 RepID=UPI0036385CAB